MAIAISVIGGKECLSRVRLLFWPTSATTPATTSCDMISIISNVRYNGETAVPIRTTSNGQNHSFVLGCSCAVSATSVPVGNRNVGPLSPWPARFRSLLNEEAFSLHRPSLRTRRGFNGFCMSYYGTINAGQNGKRKILLALVLSFFLSFFRVDTEFRMNAHLRVERSHNRMIVLGFVHCRR